LVNQQPGIGMTEASEIGIQHGLSVRIVQDATLKMGEQTHHE
jgi:hypothetical protein